MIFAKYINRAIIVRCPRCGYVGKKAVSNLGKYFELNPKEALAQGYMEYIPCDEITEKGYVYSIENGKIIERVNGDDN